MGGRDFRLCSVWICRRILTDYDKEPVQNNFQIMFYETSTSDRAIPLIPTTHQYLALSYFNTEKLKPSANKTNNLARFYNYQTNTHTQNTKNEKILKPILWIAYPALIFLTLTIIVLCFIYTTCAHTKQYNYGKREIVSSILSFRSRLSEY